MRNGPNGGFDAAVYKAEILSQAEEAAPGWNYWRRSVEDWLHTGTELMLDLAGVSSGNTVLDVAAGTGGQAIRAAQRVGHSGLVLAVDFSPAMLSYAAAGVRAAGLDNVTFSEVDADTLSVDRASFDAVISRIGLTYFPSPTSTLRRFHGALRRGGWLAGIVYSKAEANAFLSLPLSALGGHELLGRPTEGQPGPFSLSDPDLLRATLIDAGFTQVEVGAIDAPLRMSSVAECVAFVKDCFVGLRRMMHGLPGERQRGLWREIQVGFEAFTGPDGVSLPCELLVASGRKT